jgi:amino acid transporter
MVYGWIIGSVMVMTVALSLAELVSAWPAAGGLYFFAARLSQHRSNGKWTPIVTWMTGWFNIIGNMALVTSIDYTLSTMVMAEVVIATDFAFTPTFPHTYGVFVAIVFLHGLMGSLPTRWLARVNKVYVYFNMISSVTVIICLFVMSPQKNSAKWVFTHFDADTVGWPAGMAFMLGLIDVMWSLTGYDCAAHLSEECRDAATAAPKAIYQSVAGVATTGWILILAVAFTVPSIDDALASATGMPMAQIIYSNCGKPATLVLWFCIMLVQFFSKL